MNFGAFPELNNRRYVFDSENEFSDFSPSFFRQYILRILAGAVENYWQYKTVVVADVLFFSSFDSFPDQK